MSAHEQYSQAICRTPVSSLGFGLGILIHQSLLDRLLSSCDTKSSVPFRIPMSYYLITLIGFDSCNTELQLCQTGAGCTRVILSDPLSILYHHTITTCSTAPSERGQIFSRPLIMRSRRYYRSMPRCLDFVPHA